MEPKTDLASSPCGTKTRLREWRRFLATRSEKNGGRRTLAAAVKRKVGLGPDGRAEECAETESNELNTTLKHTLKFRFESSTSQDKWIKFEPHGKQNLYFIKTTRPKTQPVHGGHCPPSLFFIRTRI
jgi:hypothetical protein